MKRAAIMAAVLLAGFLLAPGCQSLRTETPPPGKEVGRPFVTSAVPMPGERHVPPGRTVVIEFSTDMDRASVESALEISPPQPVNVQWQDGNRLVVRPEGGWPKGAEVSITVEASARDIGGNTMAREYAWSFRVSEEYLRVVRTEPADGEGGVDLNRPVRITFDRSVVRDSAEASVDIRPAMKGTFSWEGNTLTFTPSPSWDAGTTYVVTVRNDFLRGVRDLHGDSLSEPARFAFTTRAQTALWQVNRDGTGLERLAVLDGKVVAAVWSPAGRHIALLIEEGLSAMEGFGHFGSLWVMDGDGRNLRRISTGYLWTEADDLGGAWSRDGKTLLFNDVWYPDQSGGIWEGDVGTGEVRLLVQAGTEEIIKTTNPVRSPDGRRIAFRVYGDWHSHVYVANRDGSRLRRLALFDIRVSEYSFRALHWDPDGTAVTSEEEDETGEAMVVWRISLDGTRERLFMGWRHAWSPDGRRIAFVNNGIRVYDREKKRTTVVAPVTGYVRWGPVWSPDGTYLAYETHDDFLTPAEGFWVVSLDGKPARRITTLPTWGIKSWSPDGRRLLFVSSRLQE